MGKDEKDGERISLWQKKRKRENKNGKMVGNIKGILGNINGNIRIILYKYNMYSLTFSLAFCSNILININIVSNYKINY